MSENYEDILSRSWDEMPEVVNLPEGSWRLRLRNASFKEGKGDQNDRVMFIYTPVEPGDDVDEDALAALPDDYDYSSNRLFFSIWVEGPADWDAVRKHVQKHSFDYDGSDTPKETFKKMRKSEVMAHLSIASFTDSAGELREENQPSAFTEVE